MCRVTLLRKINGSGGSADEAKKMAARMELYRHDLRICAAEFEVQVAPAVAKAVQDARDLGVAPPASFPRRTAIEDREENIPIFNDKPPADEQVQDSSKRKTKSRAQKALDAMAAELEESTILLPSDYHKLVHDHVGLRMAVDTEMKLREGLAAEALDKVRLHLTTYQALEQ